MTWTLSSAGEDCISWLSSSQMTKPHDGGANASTAELEQSTDINKRQSRIAVEKKTVTLESYKEMVIRPRRNGNAHDDRETLAHAG